MKALVDKALAEGTSWDELGPLKANSRALGYNRSSWGRALNAKGQAAPAPAPAETAPDLAPQIPDHLVDEILAGNCVLFVGAGFSAPAGFPGWKKLLLNTADHGHEEGKISSELKELVGQLLAADWPPAHNLDQAAQLLDDQLSQDGEPVQEAMVSLF